MPNPGTMTVSRQGDREIIQSRVFAAPRELVFDCLTKPELIKRWLFGPEGWHLPVCKSDLREGGAIRYVWRHPEKPDIGMSGIYKEIVRPERIVHSEVFDVDWTGGEALATTELVEREGVTTLKMTIRYSSFEARESVLQSGLAAGMAVTYDRLDELLPTVAPN